MSLLPRCVARAPGWSLSGRRGKGKEAGGRPRFPRYFFLPPSFFFLCVNRARGAWGVGGRGGPRELSRAAGSSLASLRPSARSELRRRAGRFAVGGGGGAGETTPARAFFLFVSLSGV